jgi:hypothetical protein
MPPRMTPTSGLTRDRLLTPRFVFLSLLGSAAAMLALGLPAAVIPNPLFTRMTPTEPFNVAVWLASSALIGVVIATYVGKPPHRTAHARHTGGGAATTLGGVAAFLAVGCPICNKLVVAALGVSGAFSIFAPVQPVIGAASVALLGATLAWRVRQLSRRCLRCAEAPRQTDRSGRAVVLCRLARGTRRIVASR